MSENKKFRRRILRFATHPGQWFTHPARQHYHRRYHGRYRYARSIFLLDLILVGVAFGLGIIALILAFYKPMTIADKVIFEASVAPVDIVSGADSTLTIYWTNTTGEELRDASLLLGYPDHFLLENVTSETDLVENDRVEIGSIPIDGTGMIRVRGVMFGDVGGQQTFRSILTFTHGEENEVAQKISYHSFTPVRSTLALDLALPERLVGYQEVTGTIMYQNTGEVDFPEISIEPEWPSGFVLLESTSEIINGNFRLPAITAGQSGTMEFTGRLDTSAESVEFIFHPSFTFGDTRYRQETLSQSSPLIPPPVSLSHSLASTALQPGGLVEVTIRYENIGEYPVTEIELGLDSDSPFFRKSDLEANTFEIDNLDPGDTGEATLSIPLRSSIMQSETEVYENLTATTRATASFIMGDGTPQRVVSYGQSIETPITSPVVLDAFGRYTSPQGDQLGRGPLPPYVGAETKYWVFINVSGTTSALDNVNIEGQLPSNVRFTGKQTVSFGNSVEYDSDTHTISWSANQIDSTFAPTSYVVGLAFEVGLTPTENQVGIAPTLLDSIQITGTDTNTGAFIGASAPTVTTDMPYDAMAAGLGVVTK